MLKLCTWLLISCFFNGVCAEDAEQCKNNPGMADSYVLALSSQPGFCQTYGYEAGKPECSKLSKNSYQAHHLTLHGLWPNQDSCGQQYGYCDVKMKANHCDYPPLNLNQDVSNELKILMPSFYYGSCLERHEWNKHGSCQLLSDNDYFTLAMRLTKEMDATVFGNYLTEHQGNKVKLAELREALVQSFGASSKGKVYLGCKNGILVDIMVVLPALIPFNEPLETLVSKAPDYKHRDGCPANVIISNFSKEPWF